MKHIIINGKKTLIDFAGQVKADHKALPLDLFRSFGIGNHFGENFTLSIKTLSNQNKTDIKALKELARSLGATEDQIEDCISSIPKADAVSFAEN